MCLFHRHRNKTLRLSIVIVLAFLSCWTPFVIINLWLLFDPKGVDDRIEDHVQTFMLVLAGKLDKRINVLLSKLLD